MGMKPLGMAQDKADVDIRPLLYSLQILEESTTLHLDAVVSAQNPGMNPALLAVAVGTHLPELEAEGQAAAILKVQQALADSIKLLNEANPNDQVVKIKALEAFQAAADGKATKISGTVGYGGETVPIIGCFGGRDGDEIFK